MRVAPCRVLGSRTARESIGGALDKLGHDLSSISMVR
jgi:hypothetical protein